MDMKRCGSCNVLLDFDTWEFNGLCKVCYEVFIYTKEFQERKSQCEGKSSV